MKRFRNILVSVDSRAEALPALDWGVKLAEQFGSRLTVVDTVPDFPWYLQLALTEHEHVRELLLHERRELLAGWVQPLKERGLAVNAEVLVGRTSTQLIGEVQRGGYDLVIRVSKGTASRRSGFLGTTSMKLLRKCPCPVWIVKPEPQPSFKCVVAAIDPVTRDPEHQELNERILTLAGSICEAQQGALQVVHVWSIYGETLLRPRASTEEWDRVEASILSDVEESLAETLAPHGIPLRDPRVNIVRGEPGVEIPRFVRDRAADLLVMGTVGRSGVAGALMGNTAEMILNSVDCGVLALKPSAFTCPVSADA